MADTTAQSRGERLGHRRPRRHVPHSERTQEIVRQRNARERRRVDDINNAFGRLLDRLPVAHGTKPVSKIAILRIALRYIKRLIASLDSAANQPAHLTGQITSRPQCQGEELYPKEHVANACHSYSNASLQDMIDIQKEMACWPNAATLCMLLPALCDELPVRPENNMTPSLYASITTTARECRYSVDVRQLNLSAGYSIGNGHPIGRVT